jgi:hypothetical protein
MPVTQHPPHRSQRAELPHWAPTSGCDAKPLVSQHSVFCQVRSMFTPVPAYRSQTSFSEFPLVTGLSSSTSSMGSPNLVRYLHRYYVDVRLLSSVHIRIIHHRPSLTDPLIPAGTAETSRFSCIERPRMHRVSDSAGPVCDSLYNAAHRVAFPIIQQGRHPKTVISELNTWPTLPLSTLRMQPHDYIRMTRGHDGSATPFM